MTPPTCAPPRRVLQFGAFLVALGSAGVSPAGGQQVSSQPVLSRVSGAVFDSVAAAPLAGALVQLVDAANPTSGLHSATTDARGRYVLDSVPVGRYLAGFQHPVLDSLGLEQTIYAVQVRDGQPVHLDLAVPSPARIRAAYCGPRAGQDSSGLLVGDLIDARTRGVVGDGSVVARWAEITIDAAGLHQQIREAVGKTSPIGWFAICGVPAGGEFNVFAWHGADTSGVVTVHVPLAGIAHRNFFVGLTERVAVQHVDSAGDDSTGQRVAPAVTTTIVARGPGRITGRVHTDHGIPIRDARVSVVGSGIVAITNEQGAFTLAAMPEGTQVLDTRALGYFPDERPVDVLERDMPAVDVPLATTRSVLDTMRIAGRRVIREEMVDFQRRARMGIGQFYDRQKIERMHLLETTDLFRRTLSLHAQGSRLRVRGQTCLPILFLNGMPIQLLDDLNEIDMFVRPDDIQGIELYTAGEAPPQYQRMGACASVVIWTR